MVPDGRTDGRNGRTDGRTDGRTHGRRQNYIPPTSSGDNKSGMIFHENCLLADNSHEISYLIFSKIKTDFEKNLSSAAVVNGALRVKIQNEQFHTNILSTYLGYSIRMKRVKHTVKRV